MKRPFLLASEKIIEKALELKVAAMVGGKPYWMGFELIATKLLPEYSADEIAQTKSRKDTDK